MWLAEGICKDVVIAIDGFEDELFIDCLALKKVDTSFKRTGLNNFE